MHPQQPPVGLNRASELRRRLVRHAVQRVRRVDQRLEPCLLFRGAREGFVAPVIAGVALGRQQRLVADHLHAGLGPLNELAQLLRQRGWHNNAEGFHGSTLIEQLDTFHSAGRAKPLPNPTAPDYTRKPRVRAGSRTPEGIGGGFDDCYSRAPRAPRTHQTDHPRLQPPHRLRHAPTGRCPPGCAPPGAWGLFLRNHLEQFVRHQPGQLCRIHFQPRRTRKLRLLPVRRRTLRHAPIRTPPPTPARTGGAR